jgi:cyclopropane fatty-acyl-phospholipid synthase-like methyltransferase
MFSKEMLVLFLMDKDKIEAQLAAMGKKPSFSEDKGLELIGSQPQRILSIGISSGGFAEIKMALLNPANHIIATTIDENGLQAVRKNIKLMGLEDRIEIKLEDVSGDWRYSESQFDFIYARLVLHYLNDQKMAKALSNIYGSLKPGGTFFSVVHSEESPKKYAGYGQANFDDRTGLTAVPFFEEDGTTVKHEYVRRFYSIEEYEKLIELNGFEVKDVKEFDELLYIDFMRTIPAEFGEDTLIYCVARKDANETQQ